MLSSPRGTRDGTYPQSQSCNPGLHRFALCQFCACGSPPKLPPITNLHGAHFEPHIVAFTSPTPAAWAPPHTKVTKRRSWAQPYLSQICYPRNGSCSNDPTPIVTSPLAVALASVEGRPPDLDENARLPCSLCPQLRVRVIFRNQPTLSYTIPPTRRVPSFD
ncbi:hypothetical protein BDN72DRAFT_319328 [Pluteus cervinus]|uniref:Uncharacterized protein n=1 Tax=Pluteus cervinus TaxID=181527 RepID=A0ACD3ACY5_9AGAR|nr:hypothetical protein BDN72DRAFT_319328 [Pluteus cervinus]